jgi:hypothetical protein
MAPRYALIFALVVGCLGGHASPGSAYDRRTHGLLSERAFGTSAGALDYLRAIGLTATRELHPSAVTRPDLLSDFVNRGTALDWLVEGSIREDDYKTDLSIVDCAPPENPPSDIDRIRNHFYDPDTNLGMRFGPFTGVPAPDWATGEQGRGPGSEQNQFSLLDARLYQLRSLIEATREDRHRYAALMFRSLGHAIHILQDMAQPQHTRNDLHPACENALSGHVIPEHSWYEDYIERRALGRQFLGRPTRPLSIAGYPAPVLTTARSYFTHANRRSGLADFSSHNFFSARTNLGNLCGGREQPACRPDAYRTVDVPHSVTTLFGVRLEAPVRLLLHTAEDPITRAPIPDVAVSSWSVWNQHLESRGLLPTYSMNALNYDSISDVLLPRAAGYSAGLLDHFFAGRLDASVQPAGGDDPGVLKLVARNDSDDAVDGVMLVYAEDTLTGQRHSVLTPSSSQPLGAVPTGVVLAGAPFSDIPFRPPFVTEKYVVVHHGRRLGPSRVEEPPAGAIGAVMAQVLGGPRAEAIVPQGERRLLRAVAGTFALPAEADGLAMIQWSDVDNHFVGVATTPLSTGHPAPDELKLFRLERPAGSVAVPLVAEAEPPIVAATLVKTVPFPYGLALPMTVDYTRRLRIRQPLMTYPRAVTLQWQEAAEAYDVVTEVVGQVTLEVPVDETVTFAERFPIVLDRARLFGATLSAPRPYFWRVLEVGHDARERLLALVEVRLTQPESSQRSVTLRARGEQCAGFEPRSTMPLTGTFRGEGILALIDVERGETVGLTSAPLYAPSSTEHWPVSPLLQERQTVTRIGGPLPGTETRCLDQLVIAEDPEFDADVQGAITLPHTGVAELAVPGLLRAEVDAAVGAPIGITSLTNESVLVYAQVEDVYKAVRVTSPSSAVTGQLPVLREGTRMRPGSEVLLRFERPTSFRELPGVLVRWDPTSPAETRRALPDELASGRYRLLQATPEAAWLSVEDVFTDEPQTVLADLTDGTLTAFPGDLSSDFVLLAPGTLYHVGATRFYTRDTLAETALPLPLAPGPASALGAYHLIVQD